MTLYEQYKNDIYDTSITQIAPGLSFAGCTTCGCQDDCICEYKNTLIKQSYLNAIDCMKMISERGAEASLGLMDSCQYETHDYHRGVNREANMMLDYLNKQRKLIEEHVS